MNVIIHDLTDRQFQQIFPQTTGDTLVISDNGHIKNCIGCFGCWIKTPGQCVMKDGYENMGSTLSRADTVTIISKCYYGGYSPFVKNVLDRSIPFLLPFFRTINNETHHKPRHKKSFQLYVYFYGSHMTRSERDTAKNMVDRNSINFNVSRHGVTFSDSMEQLCGKIGGQQTDEYQYC